VRGYGISLRPKPSPDRIWRLAIDSPTRERLNRARGGGKLTRDEQLANLGLATAAVAAQMAGDRAPRPFFVISS